MEELAKYLRALVLFQIAREQEVSERTGRSRIEPLLAQAGFSHREIGELVGKTPTAVAKAVSRAKAANRKQTNAEEETEA